MNQMKSRVAFKQPEVVARNVTAITFNKDSEQVESVNNYTLKDGKVIAFNGRETPTRGRELTILEQILGNVGRGGMLPQRGRRASPATARATGRPNMSASATSHPRGVRGSPSRGEIEKRPGDRSPGRLRFSAAAAI